MRLYPRGMKPLDIYVRVSRKGDREEERFHSPAEQAERARAHLAARGYTAGVVFEDIDVSGAVAPEERPGMAQALARVEEGVSGGLAAYSLDRFSRDPAHGDALVRRVTAAGGVLVAPDLPEDITSPSGEFTFSMLLGVARLYRRTSGARFESAKARATRAGIRVGPVPFGYRQRADRTLEPDPELAPVVRELFERRAAGDGWTVLARVLATATGRPWTRQGAAAIVHRRLYASGRLEYGEWESEVEAGAIVDWPLWEAAQRPGRKFGRSPAQRWLLSGLVKCGTCGRNLQPWTGSARQGSPRRYRCPALDACPARASVSAEEAEGVVVARVLGMAHRVVTQAPKGTPLEPLEAALERAEARLAQALAPEAQDALGGSWAAVVKERREALELAAAALGQAQLEVPDEEARTFELAQVWEELPRMYQRDALAWYLAAVDVAPVERGESRDTGHWRFHDREEHATRAWRPPLEWQPLGFDWQAPA